jgi:hypothetical protein
VKHAGETDPNAAASEQYVNSTATIDQNTVVSYTVGKKNKEQHTDTK